MYVITLGHLFSNVNKEKAGRRTLRIHPAFWLGFVVVMESEFWKRRIESLFHHPFAFRSGLFGSVVALSRG
jgi:pyridoxine/pyridoxamine 5'-phosphate oxidase